MSSAATPDWFHTCLVFIINNWNDVLCLIGWLSSRSNNIVATHESSDDKQGALVSLTAIHTVRTDARQLQPEVLAFSKGEKGGKEMRDHSRMGIGQVAIFLIRFKQIVVVISTIIKLISVYVMDPLEAGPCRNTTLERVYVT
jgi:hypothetical protein